MKLRSLVLVTVAMLGCTASSQTSHQTETCIQVLKDVAVCDDFWVKVHAVEYLIESGFREDADALIKTGLASFQNEPQKRIGYWRASYLNASHEAEKQGWLDRIKRAYLDTTGPDRIHAAETLAKLSYSFLHFGPNPVQNDQAGGGVLADFVRWGMALPKEPSQPVAYDSLLAAVRSTNQTSRKLAAYALGFIGALPAHQWPVLAQAALDEPDQSEAAAYLLSTAYALAPTPIEKQADVLNRIRQRLLTLQNSDRKADRIELCRALARKGTTDDVSLLLRYLNLENRIETVSDTTKSVHARDHPQNLDVQAAAAYALLQLEKRARSADI
ncbi:hypothetical protein LX87_05371 [Larkinella arboricola]|uniref:HEAT repeat protein n=1 Tax=Larkinella arboricola TaxID=643671 RepID=A0A327WIS4_LARAB|nr:hypothetical protein [Larkinella arboricola]RAJ91030.1 hypothetical protein LX87_05371 [Larkinella arboricola]